MSEPVLAFVAAMNGFAIGVSFCTIHLTLTDRHRRRRTSKGGA